MSIGYKESYLHWKLTQQNNFLERTQYAQPKKIALFLDFDGTLTPIVDHPCNVLISTDTRFLLKQLALYCEGALAIITGRTIKDIDSLLSLKSLYVAGIHGAEWRTQSKTFFAACFEKDIAQVTAKIKDLLKRFPEVWLEDKSYSIAIHYRAMPSIEQKLFSALQEIISDYQNLDILLGKMVFEIKNSNINKGKALSKFMEDEPFVNRFPIAIGDDVTDEYAFKKVNELGGYSIKIGEGETCAKQRLANPKQLHDWLAQLLVF
ncbi:trehalose-phosphatase [Entomomonas asaccharolytica]|uniref:Trehalose 6-phosphate phosphatase n=1 Tax=Entomomonas asaccharolytica TaxID=2785331 RepID=A0A974NF67_9GAMM|nr:trehalose-phosphatase [Entomomonas asaccharolytica]QQP85480.1 trehalose-phosphatase [Entomomonas asaccharolytica]